MQTDFRKDKDQFNKQRVEGMYFYSCSGHVHEEQEGKYCSFGLHCTHTHTHTSGAICTVHRFVLTCCGRSSGHY